MLEIFDSGFIDNVSSFLSGLVDSLCGLTRPTETTSSVTEYLDTVNYLFKRHKSFE